MSANEVAERLQRHKTKTEARLEKERQTKVQQELEAMSQPHINKHNPDIQYTPIYDRIDKVI